jgi:hypothetical protein
MSMTAIRTTFPDEWVAVVITEVDTADVPVAGVVLTHSPEKAMVYQVVKTHLAHDPTMRLFLFYTGDPIPVGVGVMGALR